MGNGKLYLCGQYTTRLSSHHVAYVLETEDVHNSAGYERYYAMATEIILSVLKNCTVLASLPYDLRKTPKNRLFFPNRPAQFWPNSYADNLQKQIETENIELETFLSEHHFQQPTKHGKSQKRLFILSKHIDMRFLNTLGTPEHTNYDITGYVSGTTPLKLDCVRDYAENYWNATNYVVYICFTAMHNMLEIHLNPLQLSAVWLVEQIERTAREHDFELEVHL